MENSIEEMKREISVMKTQLTEILGMKDQIIECMRMIKEMSNTRIPYENQIRAPVAERKQELIPKTVKPAVIIQDEPVLNCAKLPNQKPGIMNDKPNMDATKGVRDLLGQPSGKYDYWVYYSKPASYDIPLENVMPTGWGNEEVEAKVVNAEVQKEQSSVSSDKLGQIRKEKSKYHDDEEMLEGIHGNGFKKNRQVYPQVEVEGKAWKKTRSKGGREHFELIPVTYTDLLPILLRSRAISCIQEYVQLPCAQLHNDGAQCEYHLQNTGHWTEDCISLKRRVKALLGTGCLNFNWDSLTSKVMITIKNHFEKGEIKRYLVKPRV